MKQLYEPVLSKSQVQQIGPPAMTKRDSFKIIFLSIFLRFLQAIVQFLFSLCKDPHEYPTLLSTRLISKVQLHVSTSPLTPTPNVKDYKLFRIQVSIHTFNLRFVRVKSQYELPKGTLNAQSIHCTKDFQIPPQFLLHIS